MDWSRTKTIFIIAFLMVNVFLGFQLYEKRNENQYEFISESMLEIEDQLQSMGITYPDLPEAPKKLMHIIGRTHQFSDSEFDDQDLALFEMSEDDKKLIVIFDEDRRPASPDADELLNYLGDTIPFRDEYVYSDLLSSEDGSEVVFLQTYDGRPIYQKKESTNGKIVVQLSDDQNVVSYRQTYLDTNPQGNEQDILTAMKAINQLYNNDWLEYGDEITKIELGYYSLVEGEVQVLAPTWLVVVNDARYYFINAINGLIDVPDVDVITDTGEEETA